MRLHLLLLACVLPACGVREEGLRLRLALRQQPATSASAEGSVRRFSNPSGEQITLTRAHVSLQSVEMLPCPKSAWRRWWEGMSLIGTAHAHSTSTPLRLGVPHVTGLERADGEAWELGTLHPPPGAYCRVRLVLGPADEDAVGAPPEGLMVGRTLLLEGKVAAGPGLAERDFRLTSAGLSGVELPLEGVSLSAESPERSLVFSLAYDRWLEGVRWEAPGEAGEQALANVAGFIQLDVQPR